MIGRIGRMTKKVKISATLPLSDLRFLEGYMKDAGFSRSRALQDAVQALRKQSLEAAYLEADEEWYADSDTAEAWATTDTDGLTGSR